MPSTWTVPGEYPSLTSAWDWATAGCTHEKNKQVSNPNGRYVPNPSPSVFRTTKNNHNILQGVADPSLRLTKEQKENFDAWILKNGLRWTAEGGPLAPGGCDIAFIGASIQIIYSKSSQASC